MNDVSTGTASMTHLQRVTRAEYSERAREFYQPRVPTPVVKFLIFGVFIGTTLLVYGDIGPRSFGARLGIVALLILGVFVAGHVSAASRARRLGLLCSNCGHFPLGLDRFFRSLEAQMSTVLDRGRCAWCQKDLFRSNA